MTDRHSRLLRALLDAVGGREGHLDAGAREELLAGRPTSGALGAFAVKVAHNSTSIRDEHVTALTAAGVPEEDIFDAIVASAIGAGMERLRVVLRLLGADNP
jgi:hypothetical protein